MNLNNITTALKTGITIYQYEQWQKYWFSQPNAKGIPHAFQGLA